MASDTRSDAKEITAFVLPGQSANPSIDPMTRTVVVNVPFGTSVTSVTPTITVSPNASFSPTGARNFTNPVTYTVTAENETTQDWTVTVNVASDTRSDAKEITAFVLPGQTTPSVIDNTNHTVTATVPFGTDITDIIPLAFSVSTNADYNPKGARSFTTPITYTIIAENESTQDWTVTVNVEADTRSDAKEITAFSFPGQSGNPIIDPMAKTITVNVPFGTAITGITPTISISPNAIISPTGARDFNTIVSYTVTAENESTQNWTVIVNVQTIPVTGITIAPTSEIFVPGQERTLTATVAPSNASDLTYSWSSSNESVAIIDNNGKVIAQGLGTTIISVTSTLGGLTDTLSITVSEPYLDLETGAFYGLPGERIFNRIRGGGGVRIEVTIRTGPGASGEYLGGEIVNWGNMSGGCTPFDFTMPDSGIVYVRATASDTTGSGMSAGVTINSGVSTDVNSGSCQAFGSNEQIQLDDGSGVTRMFPEDN